MSTLTRDELPPLDIHDLLSFVRLVREMREAQRAYYKARDATRLITAKQLEAKVDTALGRFI